MTKFFIAEWENVDEYSEDYGDFESACFSSFSDAKEWLGDKLESSEYDCTVLVEEENRPGTFKIALKGWLP